MSSSCIEEVSVPNDDWYRIAAELLGRAGIEINGSAPSDLRVKNPLFFKRVLQEGSLGLGESYMDGWWECERLDIFFHKVLRAGLEKQLPHHFKDTLRIAGARLFNLQSKKRAWIVGKEHYDLGNDLFSRMLDPYMQYSCGYWKEAQSLEAAQQAKLDLICRKLELEPGMRVLDIGCGWGGLAEYMARNYQVSVVGVTISAEQQKMAQARCADLDVEIRLQDYRDLHDSFDRIVSVGMFGARGAENYATYLRLPTVIWKPTAAFYCTPLAPRSTITLTRGSINIFPNGCLPSVRHIAEASEKHFVMEDWHNFGADYDNDPDAPV
ncbi:cyclopropane fatty acyl phospholipid synthase [Klebsiella pneumoniae]|nr:cyclopropane fatty acyl phospholipid synthase [Klebsiella pneumoniae]